MLKNYFKIALRNILRQKGYSFLNILGLSIGIASCLFILLYVQFELNYDTYHKDFDRVFRVATTRKTNTKLELFATAPMPAAPTIKDNFPEVLESGRCSEASAVQVKYKDKQFIEEKTGYADNGLFQILDIPIIYGNRETILKRPRTVVITEKISEKYFGNVNPVGEVLMIDTTAYEVDGVIKNFPANTHLKKDLLLCFQTVLDRSHEMMREMGLANLWAAGNCASYIKLREGIDPKELEVKIRSLPAQYNSEDMRNRGIGVEATLFLQPITDIHLFSNLIWETEPPGNITYIFVFSAIGVLILLLACMNYINLMTARSSNRSNEVGIRKVIGAMRSQLISQFIGESAIITLISIIFSMLIVVIFLPFFNILTGLDFSFNSLAKPEIVIGIFVIAILISIGAGSYPALFLSRLKPVSTLKGTESFATRKASMRKLLVMSQFAISIMLIIGMIIFYMQVDYMKNQYLGFDKEQKLVIEFDRNIINPRTYENVKHAFSKHPSILQSSFSSSVPGRWMYYWRLRPFDDKKNSQMVNCFQVDNDFMSEYKLEIIAGRSFMRERGTDNYDQGWIINEAAVKAFGWRDNDEALKHAINRPTSPIIGVVKNFHIKGLQNKIEPLALFFMAEDFRYLTLKVNIENTDKVISFIKNKHAELFPGYLFNYFFLNDNFNKQYQSEETTASLLGLFTSLGIIIAIIGLFGLASLLVEKRTKEVGIRKVLGASVHVIAFMLTKEFIKWVLIANIVAWPMAYFLMNKWLEDFAYRINVGLIPFFSAMIIALLIAVLTVSYQTVKAASANPVDSLRSE